MTVDDLRVHRTRLIKLLNTGSDYDEVAGEVGEFDKHDAMLMTAWLVNACSGPRQVNLLVNALVTYQREMEEIDA